MGLIVNMSDILFDTNEATLKPGAKENLAKVSGILLAYPTLRITVEGHTDSTGTDEYNLKLSEHRADSVREYLMATGISSANIESHGMGTIRLQRTRPPPDANRIAAWNWLLTAT